LGRALEEAGRMEMQAEMQRRLLLQQHEQEMQRMEREYELRRQAVELDNLERDNERRRQAALAAQENLPLQTTTYWKTPSGTRMAVTMTGDGLSAVITFPNNPAQGVAQAKKDGKIYRGYAQLPAKCAATQ